MSLKPLPWSRPLRRPFEEVFIALENGQNYKWRPFAHRQVATRLCIPADYANDKLRWWNQTIIAGLLGGNPWGKTLGSQYQLDPRIAEIMINVGNSVKLWTGDYGLNGIFLCGLGWTRCNWSLDKANKKFSFEFYLDNDLEETDPTVIYDDDEDFWTAWEGWSGSYSCTKSEELTEKVKGTSSVKITIAAGSARDVGVQHDYGVGSEADFSGKELLCVYLYGVNTGKNIGVSITSGGAYWYQNGIEWTIIDNFSGWKRFILPFNNPTFTWGSGVTLSAVRWITVRKTRVSGTETWYLDRTVIDTGQWCYDRMTEVLTKDGWKLFKDITFQDEIATLNPDTFELEYHNPTHIQKFHYKGKMYKWKGKQYDLVVTPEHSLFYKPTRRKAFTLGSIKDFSSWSEPEFKKDAKWVGQEQEWFELPYVYNAKHVVDRIWMDDWLEFFGWWTAEGWTTEPENGQGYPCYRVGLSQRKIENRKEILALIVRMDFHYVDDGTNIIINSKQLWSYLKEFGRDKERYLPQWLKELSPRQLSVFLESYWKGDGRADGRTAGTVSKRLADDLQEIILKAGYASNIWKKERGLMEIKGKEYKCQDIYIISWLKKELTPIVTKKPEIIDYDDMVYDVTVPNHIIYVRRNGKPIWSGNCKVEVWVPDVLALAGNIAIIRSWTGSDWSSGMPLWWGADSPWNGDGAVYSLYFQFLDGTFLSDIVTDGYRVGMATYHAGLRGETKSSKPVYNDQNAGDITYSSYYGCKKRIGFAIKNPPDDGQDSSIDGISQCKLKLEVYYDDNGKTTYEFEDSTNQYYGLRNQNDSWIAAFDETTKKVEFLILSKRPTGLTVRADHNELIDEVVFTLAKGTRVFAGELVHGKLDRDTDGDGVPDFLEDFLEPLITKMFVSEGYP